MSMFKHSFIRLALPVTVALLSPVAIGQHAILEEVIITAQKRAQSLQEVSIAVTAFTGDQLDALGADTGYDLAKFIPNVQFQNNGPNSNFVVRGISLGDFGDGNESPVGFYIDEVYKGTLAGQTAQLFDVDRIEVLRGPQGTLFGRNTTGGLVHVVTRKPTEEFELYGNLQYGDHEQVIVDGAVSGALSDRVRGRFAFKSNTDDGWQESEVNGKEFAVTDVWAARALLEVDLSNAATLLLSVSGSEQDNISMVYGFVGNTDAVSGIPCSDAELGALAPNCVTVGGLQSDLDPENIFTEADDLIDDVDIFNASATLTWELGELTLTSISAYGTVERFFQEDAAGPTSAAGLPPAAFVTDYFVESTQFTQELRLNGSTENLNWIVGAFYYDDEKDDAGNGLPAIAFSNAFTLDSESWAVFGQFEYDLTERLAMIAGVRYTQDDKVLNISGSPAPGVNFSADSDIDTNAITWKVGLDWNLNEDTLLYANVSKGFKSGTFNTTLLVSSADAAPVGEEELVNYELGWKTTLMNGMARFNGAFFYSDYSDIQGVNVESLGGGAFATRLVALGDADIRGAELEFIVSPMEALNVMLTAGWIETEVDTDVVVGGIAIDGNELSDAARFNASAIGIYTVDMGDRGSLATQLSANWRDDYYNDILNTGSLVQDGFWLLGARLSWESVDEKFSAALFGENLGNEEYIVGAFNVDGLAQSRIWGKTRTWGLEVGYRY
jgi:iron complex outermembrane receptor protein